MKKTEVSPEEFGSLDRQIASLREHFEKNSSPGIKGAALAEVHIECRARLLAYWQQLDAMLGYELADPELGFEENIPRINTALRMFRELTTMIFANTEALLNCSGGSAAVGIQALSTWASQEPRYEFFLRLVQNAVDRVKRFRK